MAAASTKKTAASKTASKKAPSSKSALKKPTSKESSKKLPSIAPRDVMQDVTDRILAELRAGAAPWVKSWRSIPGAGIPSNFATGRPYTGTNVVLLWMTASSRGYPTNQWLTFQQALDLGGNVRKGETGTKIVFLGTGKRREETVKEGERDTYAFWKQFTVFNAAQCDGLPEKAPVERVSRNPDRRDPEIDALLVALGSDVREGHGEAAYYPSADYITMPSFESFDTADHFYSTNFHEHGHWTGAKHRLNRDLKSRAHVQDYALEELVAELTAAFCCADYGLDGDLRHAGYIQHWIKLLEADKNAFSRAASAAQKAYKFLGETANRADMPESDDEAGEAMLLAAA